MIRPFTLLCFLLACGSGLYLYQSKHRAQMLDRQIEQTVHDTQAARDKMRLLDAEWTLLNDPERLRALSDQFLALKPVAPGQFTSLAELDHRLPPVRPPDAPLEPVPEPAVMPPMVAPPVAPPVAQATPAPTPAPETGPAKPLVAQSGAAPNAAAGQVAQGAQPAAPPAAQPAAPKPAADRIQVADRRPPAPPRQAAEPPRPTVVAIAQPRPAPQIVPRYAAPFTPVSAPQSGTGSVLGMAGRTSLPPPKPIALFQPADGH